MLIRLLPVRSLASGALFLLAGAVDAAERSSPPISCRDFRHNADGSWSPKRPVTIGSVTMGQGVSFRGRVVVEDVDLTAALDHQCP
jgi:hypothetical protein